MLQEHGLEQQLCRPGWLPGAATASNTNGYSGTATYTSFEPPPQAPTLRLYQVDAIDRITAEFENGRQRVLAVAPTGSGKTLIAADLIARAVARGQSVLFLCHRKELVEQASCKLAAVGVKHGIIKAGIEPRPGETVQIASIQTLTARAVRTQHMSLPPADLIIYDEVHHILARTNRKLINLFPGAHVIGLSATPARGDGRGLGQIFEAMVEIASVQELIDSGFLVPTRVFAPSNPDLEGVHIRHGDYVEDELAARVNTQELVGNIVEHWLKLAGNRPTVVFAVNVAHSMHIRDEFRRAGILAEHIDGKTPNDNRERILKALAAGDIEVVSNCQVLTEGWDCPECSCLVLARPTKSLVLYRQMVGRALRPVPGKTNALILDHSGAVIEFGFAEDEIQWSLDDNENAINKSRRKRSGSSIDGLITCKQCAAVHPKGAVCPECGLCPPPKKPELIAEQAGNLVEIDRKTWKAPRALFAQFLWVCKDRGYQTGWAAHSFKTLFGRFPPWAWGREQHIEPQEPTDEVRAWIKAGRPASGLINLAA